MTPLEGRMLVRGVSRGDIPALGAIHAACFGEEAWDEISIRGWIEHPQGFSSIARRGAGGAPLGFALALCTGDDAELLSIAVDPAARRGGVGRGLLDHLDSQAEGLGLDRWLLEVACDNDPALGLYHRLGFSRIGRRRAYYRRRDGAVDALVLAARVGQLGRESVI